MLLSNRSVNNNMSASMNTSNYSAENLISRLVHASESTLGHLVAQANHLLSQQDVVKTALPANCQSHCQLVSYRNRTLTLQADTAAWATKIRFQQRSLIQHLKKMPGFAKIQTVRVNVRPSYEKPESIIKAKRISQQSAEHLREIAATIEDKALSAALERIPQGL